MKIKCLLFILIFLTLHVFILYQNAYSKDYKIIDNMATVPSGEFMMGSKKSDGKYGMKIGVDEFPSRQVYLNTFQIDIYETTNQEFKKFLDQSNREAPSNLMHPKDPYIWKNNIFPKGQDLHPVVLVDWFDAEAYCKWAGKKLTTEEEWEKAARGTDRRLYPWGNRLDKMLANNLDLNLHMSVKVGSFPNGRSPYGLYDMSGNTWEWTDTWYKAYPGNFLKRGTYGETHKVTRGGSWLQPADTYGDTAERNPMPPDYRHRTIGFRCAKE